jgi:hypothetical protein
LIVFGIAYESVCKRAFLMLLPHGQSRNYSRWHPLQPSRWQRNRRNIKTLNTPFLEGVFGESVNPVSGITRLGLSTR